MTDNRVNPQNFYVVQGWMVSELGLKGNELAVYAIIYGFSQNGEEWFNGSLNYLTEWTNLSRQSIINVLKSLVKQGLIEKQEQTVKGVKLCAYRSKNLTGGSQKTLPEVVKKFDGGSQKTLPEVVKKFDGGSQKTLPNNITDNISDNITDKTDREELSGQRIAYAFCEAFGTETVSKRLLKTIRDTLQAGVSQERIEALIHSAKNKHPREPESYIAAGLKKLQASPQEQAVRFKPVSQLFEDWEEEWKREFEAMRQNMQA